MERKKKLEINILRLKILKRNGEKNLGAKKVYAYDSKIEKLVINILTQNFKKKNHRNKKN